MKSSVFLIGLAALASCKPALAIENHAQSTPTDLFFFGAGFSPSPSPLGTWGVREFIDQSAGIGPDGRKPAVQSHTTVTTTTLSWVYMTHLHILNGEYGFAVVQPFFDMNGDLNGEVNVSTPIGSLSVPEHESGHSTGIGNTEFYPIILQWMDMPHLALNTSLAIQFPDGKYNKADLLNPSTHYWTIAPTLGITYITDHGQEFSSYQEIDFNSANTATHYKSGTEYKLDIAIGQHLGSFTVGPAGYYYQQLQDDTGSGTLARGAEPGAARVFGAGIAFNYIPRHGSLSIFGDIIKEFGAINHSQGTVASLRLSVSL